MPVIHPFGVCQDASSASGVGAWQAQTAPFGATRQRCSQLDKNAFGNGGDLLIGVPGLVQVSPHTAALMDTSTVTTNVRPIVTPMR
jgi:hypothetical protein